MCLQKKNKLKQSIAFFQKALQLDPMFVEANYNLQSIEEYSKQQTLAVTTTDYSNLINNGSKAQLNSQFSHSNQHKLDNQIKEILEKWINDDNFKNESPILVVVMLPTTKSIQEIKDS